MKLRNERIRGTKKVVELSRKVQERRLQWYGHVKRRNEQYLGNRIIDMVVEGTRAIGRPKRRWGNCVENYLKDRGIDLENSEYEDREI